MKVIAWLKKQSPMAPIWVLLFPLWGIILSCVYPRKRLSYIGIVLFYALFGYAHTFEDARADAYRKMLLFKNFPSTISTYDIVEMYNKGLLSDLYEELLCVHLRPFTDSSHVFLAVVGGIAAIFLSVSLFSFVCKLSSFRGVLHIVFVSTLILLFNPVMIGGIRYITASTVFLYASVLFLLEDKWYGFVLACISPLIHFSMLVLVPTLLVIRMMAPYLSVRLLLYILIGVCVISFFMDVSSWRGLFSRFDWLATSETLSYKASAYTSSKTEIGFNKSLTTQLMKVQQYIVRSYILVFAWYILKICRGTNISAHNCSLLKYTASFLVFGCLLMSFSVVGERYLIFGQSFMIFVIVKLAIEHRDSFLRVLALLTPLAYIFLLGWIAYNSLLSISPLFFISPTLLFL